MVVVKKTKDIAGKTNSQKNRTSDLFRAKISEAVDGSIFAARLFRVESRFIEQQA